MDAWLKSGPVKRKVDASETNNPGSNSESNVTALCSSSDISATSLLIDAKREEATSA